MSSILFPLLSLASVSSVLASGGPQEGKQIPPSWQVLPIPRYTDYGATDDFLTLGRAAVVRRQGGSYQTVRVGVFSPHSPLAMDLIVCTATSRSRQTRISDSKSAAYCSFCIIT